MGIARVAAGYPQQPVIEQEILEGEWKSPGI